MISLRTISVAFALAAFALSGAGCAPSSQEPFQSNVAYSTGWGQPVTSGYGGWGSGYGYGGNSSYGQSALFRPAKGITCDRAREVCYDRYGLSYYATQRYFSERDANQSVRKFGEQVFLFTPKRGVDCDRRTRTCSDAGGLDVDWTDDVFGDKSERKVNTWLDGDSFVPERYVTCVNATKVCSDKNGPDVNLTQVYYGRAAAQDLADQLGQSAPLAAPVAAMQPVPETSAPQVSPLTDALQGAPEPASEVSAESLPVVEEPLPLESAPDAAQPIVAAPDASAPEFIPQPAEQPVVQLEPAAPEPVFTPEPQPEFQPEPQPMEQALPQAEPEPMQQAAPQPEPMPQPAPLADGGGAAPACADPAGCVQ